MKWTWSNVSNKEFKDMFKRMLDKLREHLNKEKM